MPLTDIAVRNTKPNAKPFKLYDEKGLFLFVQPTGAKYWRMRYQYADKEKVLALGVYPDISLKSARVKRDEARILLAEGVDPSFQRKLEKGNTFRVVALEWQAKQANVWTEKHGALIKDRLERHIFPWIGGRPIDKITAPELLSVLHRIEAQEAHYTAHRARANCASVFRYAVATGRAERDPAADLRGALTPHKEVHHASITDPKEITHLLQAIDGYKGSFIVRCALQLAPLVFVRPVELREATWSEFDLDTARWVIPAARMKMGEQHIVPLSKQALHILRELLQLTGADPYVFPGLRTTSRSMSENTVNAALRRLGYTKTEMTGHGFRSMASTLLNEQGWNSDVIERQLAHGERNKVRGAYNYAEYLPERIKMMQAWADYLDQIALL
jgi:integrase